jgi:HSP20 family protein
MPTRWNPFGALVRMDPFADLEDLIRNTGARSLTREYERALDMRLDVNEDDKEYVVNVDMPGVKKEDIDVSIEGNQVAIRAEVKREKTGDKGKELYNERFSGQAYRSFTLPSEIDAAGAKAAYDGGVLTLALPKKTGTAAKRLSIN